MTASEIVRNLFVGDAQDAYNWKGVRICVLEGGVLSEEYNTIWIPIYNIDGSGKASKVQLNKVADVIESLLMSEQRILVHCAAGIERSPLTVAWYLRVYCGMSIDEAYKLIKSKRPQAEDRSMWLSKGDMD